MNADYLQFLLPLAAYLVGSFPTGVVLSRHKYGIDVREMGSGNIGATNITRVFGWYAGALVFVIDFIKGLVPVWLTQKYFPEQPWWILSVGVAVVVGHCFSLFLRFRGGKGVATGIGVISAVQPILSIAAVIAYVAALAVTRIGAVGSLVGVGVAISYLVLFPPPRHVAALVGSIAALIILRHKSNIVRLIKERKAKQP